MPRPVCQMLVLLSVTSSILFSVGCDSGPELAAVSGTVRFADGEPLTSGSVEFETVGVEKPVSSTGQIQPDGTFKLGTYSADDGVLIGRHRAVVISDVQIGTGNERPGLIPEPTLNEKYRDFKTSGLEFDVQSGPNQFEIQVERAKRSSTSAEKRRP